MQCIYIACAQSQDEDEKDVNKKSDKAGKKNSQLVLRLDKDERDAFIARCKDLDTSAAREIRRFIREFMAEDGAKG